MTVTVIDTGVTHAVRTRGDLYMSTACGIPVELESRVDDSKHLAPRKDRQDLGWELAKARQRDVDCMACIAKGAAK